MPPKPIDSKEGLLKRSRRLFGTKSLDASRPIGNQASLAPNDPTSAYQRRRSQVRRAQRTHRERKENYLKSLEQEVVNLRQQNKKQARRYEAEITVLKSSLVENGLPLPDQIPQIRSEDVSSASDSPTAMVKLDPQAPEGNFMRIDWSSSPDVFAPLKLPENRSFMALSDSSMEGISVTSGLQGTTQPTSVQSSSSLGTGGFQSNLGVSPTPMYGPVPPGHQRQMSTQKPLPQVPQYDLTDAQVGIDFVLALEHPCMEHPDLLREPDTGHTLMLSNDILQSSSAPSTTQLQQSSYSSSSASHSNVGGGTNATTWGVNPTDLDRLLSLSSSFQLLGELTPVQAWTRLRQHPNFPTLDRNRLLAFQRALSQDVKCYGFGAVLDEVLFQIAMEELFETGPSLY